MPKICSIPNCGKPVNARGWCGMHYKRWEAHGDPLAAVKKKTPPQILERWLRDHSTFAEDRCLTWPFGIMSSGYGLIRFRGRGIPASRAMCEIAHGPPPSPLHDASHLCGKGHEACVNPKHLIWETTAENLARTLEHGTKNLGERVPTAKLTAEAVIAIRRAYAAGGVLHRELAERYGVSRKTVTKIINRQRWSWLQ